MPGEALTFDYLCQYSAKLKAGEQVPRLHRDAKTQAAYELHKQETRDLSSYIRSTYLTNTNKCLVKNKFPLNLEPGVTQYVLWLSDATPFADIVAELETAFKPHPFCVFENPQDWKSIPGVFHVHIFVKDFAKL